MTNFEKITREMDMDDLTDLFNSIDCIENAPWNKWFNVKYCNSEKCPTIEAKCLNGSTCQFAYCELNRKESGEGKCCFFPDKDILGGYRDVIKLWLESDVVDNG